jgi:hypothetical protein
MNFILYRCNSVSYNNIILYRCNSVSYNNIILYNGYILFSKLGTICQYNIKENKYEEIIKDGNKNIRMVLYKDYLITISLYYSKIYKIKIKNNKIKLKILNQFDSDKIINSIYDIYSIYDKYMLICNDKYKSQIEINKNEMKENGIEKCLFWGKRINIPYKK